MGWQELPIEALGLSGLQAQSLRFMGWDVGDVAEQSDEALARCANVGRVTIKRIREATGKMKSGNSKMDY